MTIQTIKISQLTASSGIADTDLLMTVKDISGTPSTRKATALQLAQYISANSSGSGGGASLSDVTASAIYNEPANQLDAAWTNLNSGLGTPTWFSASATQQKRTQFMKAVGTTTAYNRNLFDENKLTTPSGSYPGSYAFAGGVLLKDGRVFFVPCDGTTARIYDPVSDTLSTPAGTYPGGSAFEGGVLLPDGRVFCVPSKSTTARIYDPVSDILSTPAGTYPGGGIRNFAGGVLLPDGRVFCVPFNSTTARIYDPVSDTLSTPAGTYPGSGAFNGGVLLPDGRVFCIPYNTTTARIYVSKTTTVPDTIVLSPFYNKF